MARRRRNIYTRKGESRRSVIRGTAAAILLAAVVYFVVAGGLGGLIADYVILPFMGRGNSEAPVESTQLPDVSGTPGTTAQATTPPPSQTQELTISPIPFYAIQMGAFVNEANAESEAQSIRARGAAGYLYKDTDRTRVLASAYLTRADADKVREQLLSTQGLESYVLDLYSGGGAVTLRVTASEQRILGMEEAMRAYSVALDSMENIARRLDLGEIGPEGARSELRDIAQDVIAARGGFGGAAVDGESELITAYGNMMDEQSTRLIQTADDTAATAMEISARIKYVYIDSLVRHGELMLVISQ